MAIIKNIKEWLESGKMVKNTNEDIRTLRLAIRLNLKDASQVGMAKAMLSKLDVFWAELKPGELSHLMGELKIRQFFNGKSSEKKPDTKPLVIENPKPLDNKPITTQSNGRTVTTYGNGIYYHNAKGNDLCQCKHTKTKHIANPTRPYCLEKQCPCQYFIKSLAPSKPAFTHVEERKMPMLLENQALSPDDATGVDKNPPSD